MSQIPTGGGPGSTEAPAGVPPQNSRLQDAQQLAERASQLYRAGDYGGAESLQLLAIALVQNVLGPEHPHVATSLHNLALLYSAQRTYGKAEPLYLRALAIREKVLGPNHPHVATSLDTLAQLYAAQGMYGKAEPLYLRALAIREKALGPDHLDVATSLNNLAALFQDQGVYGKAEPLNLRALAIREKVLGPNHPGVATSLNNLARLYDAQGAYARAEPLHLRALAIWETALGPDHPHVATSLDNLAQLYEAQGMYGKAEPLYLRALAIREKALGPNHPGVATTLNNLAELYRERGAYARAEPLYLRALAIDEKALGPECPDVAQSLNNLAILYWTHGAYGKAEPLYLRALAIKEKALGPDHPGVATTLNNFAQVYEAQGAHAKAELLNLRALAIWEKALGPDHPDVAQSLNNLAWLYKEQGAHGKVASLISRALAIWEKALGPDHPNIAQSLSILASMHRAQGAHDTAESLYLRALAIDEKALGPDHPDFAGSLINLALLYQVQGAYGQAEPLYLRALAIWEKALGPSHPKIAICLHNVATLQVALGKPSQAVPLFRRAFDISEGHLRAERLALAEPRLSSFLQELHSDWVLIFSLLLERPADRQVHELALATVLLRKGRSLDELAELSRAIHRGLGPADRQSFEQLCQLRSQFASLSENRPSKLAMADYQQQLRDLVDGAEQLEEGLARHSAPLRARRQIPGVDGIVPAVAAALPDGGALIEVVSFRPFQFQLMASQAREERYLALVLSRDQRIGVVDLGPAAAIDDAIKNLLTQLTDHESTEAQYLPPAQQLYRLVMRPLLPLLGGKRTLFLSLDGQLNLVPFAALHDGQRFLLERYQLNYLTSGRDLLRRDDGLQPLTNAVLLADPAFTLLPGAPSGPGPSPASGGPAALSLMPIRWDPLPCTRLEAEAIAGLLPSPTLLLGSAATETALLSQSAPGILHVATHGRFLADEKPAPQPDRGYTRRAAPPPANPLLRSALVLAGAEVLGKETAAARDADSSDGLATALEISGMDLWGTQLVVLSACDTARGDVKLGQGVYGLRRAVLVAGAETLVVSLWSVDDAATRDLMVAYYQGLLQGHGRVDAMQEAARAVQLGRKHPKFWAPFIVIGQGGPLRRLPVPAAPGTP